MGEVVLHNALLVFCLFALVSFVGVMVWVLPYLTNCFLGSGPRGDEVLRNGKIFRPHVRSSTPLLAIYPGLWPNQPGLRPSQPGLKPSEPGLGPDSLPGLKPNQLFFLELKYYGQNSF